MREQIAQYKKWLIRKKRILNLIENNHNESWIYSIKKSLTYRSRDFTGKYYTADNIEFKDDDTFNVYWSWGGGQDKTLTKNISISFFDDPDKGIKEWYAEKKRKLEEMEREQAEQQELELFQKLKEKYENK